MMKCCQKHCANLDYRKDVVFMFTRSIIDTCRRELDSMAMDFSPGGFSGGERELEEAEKRHAKSEAQAAAFEQGKGIKSVARNFSGGFSNSVGNGMNRNRRLPQFDTESSGYEAPEFGG